MQVVLIHSGGLDSTVLLYALHRAGHVLHALSVDYGQRHRKELDAAVAICAELGVDHRVVDLQAVRPLLAGSALTDDRPVPEEPYDEATMRQTVVPNRNMILLSLAVAWAVSLKAEAVAYAAHAGDHATYPDCRPTFVEAMREAVRLCDWHAVELLTPFADERKEDIVRLGAELGVPLARTWSCYKGEALHCGRCGTCIERREAFVRAGVPDPTVYNEP
jgi:7-cyano-7-deazaguanine synthase